MKNPLKIIIVIPSRMGSSRFPGKPLFEIIGLPMIEHVRRRSLLANCASDVIVATCDQEIIDTVTAFGGRAIMTLDTHERCTDRIEEAVTGIDADIIVNVQGDEPLLDPEVIDKLVAPFYKDNSVLCTNIVHPITDKSELSSKNVVKVVLSHTNKIIYLSRSEIPGTMLETNITYYKQSGIMAFKKEFLHEFSKLTAGPLEKKESIDMLRVLENDYGIQGVVSHGETVGVDVKENIDFVVKTLETGKQKALWDKIKEIKI